MCGIAGVYRLGSVPPEPGQLAEDRALVQAMLRAMEYRGPDDVGVASLGRATLGARRLAILDVLGGHQPLADAEGRIWASLNGEIYNFAELRGELASRHVFRTRTDTELLPYLYRERGEGAVRALRGMFGLAVFDTVGQRLLLARDALGVKPLYVARDGGRLLWASELKSLLCDPSLPRDLDQEAFARYLSLGFVPGERTMFRAVRKLRPGCLVEVTPGAVRHERYWRWPQFLDGGFQETPLGALAEEAERRLADSVQAMLLSDVPLGVLLSGGLDSSLLVALLPEAVRTELRTFTIGFEGAGHHDERRHARRVAKHLGTRHQELMVACDLAEELPRVVAFLDEPCADPAAVPAHLVARAASSQVKVLLSGTGGDEIFGGYRRYALGSLVRAIRWLPRNLSAAAAEALGRFGLHRGSSWAERVVWLRKLLEARSRPRFFEACLAMMEPASPGTWSQAVAGDRLPRGLADRLLEEMVAELGQTPASDEAYLFAVDHLYYLPDNLLLKEDRTTMGASVEGRVPYLDVPLVEFAAKLPLRARWQGLKGKLVLRAIASRRLPLEIADRPKHGFTVPIEAWLRGPLSELVGDVFAGPVSGAFDPAVLRRWHDEHRSGRDRSGALWAALTFELWWREIASAAPARLASAGAPRMPTRRIAQAA